MLDMQKDQIQSQEPELWREQFNEQGYLVVEDAVNEITITGLRDALERVEQVVKNESLPAHLRRHVRLESECTRGQRLGRIYSDAISNIMELPLFGDEAASDCNTLRWCFRRVCFVLGRRRRGQVVKVAMINATLKCL